MTKKVLIIGGSLGGISVATTLIKSPPKGVDIEVTIIEPKTYIEIAWAAVRALFDEDMAEKITIPMSTVLKKYPALKHVRSKVTSLTKTSATLENGDTIAFDICLIASGSRLPYSAIEPWDTPDLEADEETSLKSRRDTFKKNGDMLLNAKSVLIIGGGLIGAELAGDLAGYAALREGSKPKVTVVHSGDHLVQEYTDSAAKKLQGLLEKFDVEVILNEKATLNSGKWVLKSGKEIEAEVVAKCYGVSAVNSFIKGGELDGCLDEKGWIMVDDQFRVQDGDGKIFAIGDCCNAVRKAGVGIITNKDAVAKNIAATLTCMQNGLDLQSAKLKSKSHPPGVFGITVGPYDGIFQLPFCSTTWLLPRFKNMTMFLFSAKGSMGL